MRHAPLVVAILIAAAGARSQSFAPLALPPFVTGTVGDVNGDGHQDYCAGTSVFSIYSGATGAIFSSLSRGAGFAGTYLAAGDVNADGKDDLVHSFGFVASGTVEVVSGATGATLYAWSNPPCWATGGADWNVDGFSDIVLTNETSTNRILQVRSGRDGTVLFQQVMPHPTFGTGWVLRPLGDFNGDGYDDLGRDGYQYSPPIVTTFGLQGPNGSAVSLGYGVTLLGDLNGNGSDDFFEGLQLLYRILDGNGTQLWALPASYMNPLACVGLGDLDGDGGVDVLLNFSPLPIVMSGKSLATLPGSGVSSNLVSVGDIDADGRSEAASTSGPAPTAGVQWSDPAVPIASRMIRRGVAGTTSTGRRPRIKTRGHAGLGNTIFFDLRGAMPNGVTLMAIGPAIDIDLAPLGAAGNRAYMNPQSVFAMTTDANGLARNQVTIPITTSLLGSATTAQSLVLDPAANTLGIVTSDAVDIETHN